MLNKVIEKHINNLYKEKSIITKGLQDAVKRNQIRRIQNLSLYLHIVTENLLLIEKILQETDDKEKLERNETNE